MKRHISIIVLQLIAIGISAQSLGENAGLSFYWKNQISPARMFNDNGLGKEIIIKNTPKDWFKAISLEEYSGQFDAGYGNLLIAPSMLPKFQFNSSYSSMNEADLSVCAAINIKKVISSLQVNGFYNNRPIDNNQDGFTDLPLKQRILVSNTWEAHVPNYSSFNRIRYLGLKEVGGNINAVKNDSGYTTFLGFGQLDLHSQHLLAMREKDLLLIDLRMKDLTQNRTWGLRDYTAKEWLAEASARYEYHLDTDLDIFRFGALFRQQRYNESTDSLFLRRDERMGGVFVGYDSYWGKKLMVITNVNLFYHNLAGLRINPLLKLNYSPLKKLTVNFFAGNGWRYANALTENARFLFSSRNVSISSNLQPENLWYYGLAAKSGSWINLGYFPFGSFFVSGTGKFIHQIYTQQLIANIDADAYEIRFYNLEKGDRAYRLSWGMEGQISFGKPNLTLNADYRYDIAKSTIDGILRDLPFYSRHNLILHASYSCRIKSRNNRTITLFNLQNFLYVQGPQRIPDLSSKSNDMPLESGKFARWDLLIEFPVYFWINSPKKWKNFSIHFGIDNLGNSTQPVAILHSEHPFSDGFDAGMNWNSWAGRRFFGGLKYVLN